MQSQGMKVQTEGAGPSVQGSVRDNKFRSFAFWSIVKSCNVIFPSIRTIEIRPIDRDPFFYVVTLKNNAAAFYFVAHYGYGRIMRKR